MNLTPEQRKAVVEALEEAFEFGDSGADRVLDVVLAALPEQDMQEAQVALNDAFVRFMEIAAGTKARAIAAGFDEVHAQAMAVGTYGALLTSVVQS